MHFLAACLNKFGLETQTHPTLPGRLYVTAQNSLLIQAAFPPSHTECFLRCEFVPDDQTPPASMALPGWYHMRRGLYSRDAAYGLSCKDDILTLLVASRRLGNPKDIGKLRNEHRLFKNPDGISSCEYKGQKYIHGLLCIKCRTTDVIRLYLPSVQDIALHMQSGCNPEFLAASMHLYSSQYWIKGDEVRVISGAMSGSWGLILDINNNDGIALVDLAYVPGLNDTLLNIEDSVSFPITDLQRRIRAGHLVRILDASAEASDHMGKSGIVVETDDDMDILVILDSVSKTVKLSHSIERYIVDQGLSASFSSTAQKLGALPNDDDTPMIGDYVIVQKAGSLHMMTGTVIDVNFASEQLTFLVTGTMDNCQTVPIQWITSSHNPSTLQFTSASGYNVVAGDLIKVVRGRYWNMTGTVVIVDLTEHTLTFCGSDSNITVPINHAVRLNEVQKHDPMARFIGNTCQVDLFQGQRQQVQRGDVVSESGTLLDGGRLSNEQLYSFVQMLCWTYILKAPRARTPPPSPPPDPPAQLQPATNPDVWSNPDSIFGPMAPTDVGLTPNTQVFDPWKINPEDREDMLKGEPDVPESSRGIHYIPHNHTESFKVSIRQSQFYSQMLLVPEHADCLSSLQSFEERVSSKRTAVDDLFDSSQPSIHKRCLQFDDESLQVTAQACFSLLLYRRTSLFHAPKFLLCNLDVDDRHLEALRNFIESLEGTQAPFISIVKHGEMLGDFAPLFQIIQHSGCKNLRFSDREASCLAYPPLILPDFVAATNSTSRHNFHIFYADSPIFFSQSMVAFTLTSLQNPSLTDLSLTHTSLSALQWMVMMSDINLMQLNFLSIDCNCPTAALIEFLMRHKVRQLWLYGMDHYTDQPPLGMDIPHIAVPSLCTLSGPHWYLLDATFLASTPNYLSAILDITQQFVTIDSLQLNFYDALLISESFDVTLDVDNRTIPAKKLTIYLLHWYKFSDQHPMFRCSPWLQVFQHVKNISLRPGHMSLSDRQWLEAAFCHPRHLYKLDIVDGLHVNDKPYLLFSHYWSSELVWYTKRLYTTPSTQSTHSVYPAALSMSAFYWCFELIPIFKMKKLMQEPEEFNAGERFCF
ncbi:hypothetical protein BDR06DRAFT_1011843 [Suillus hirtellus]|nr:hypothetical protein BDR06DRAFT_1011843 [Suillus hirtellus]